MMIIYQALALLKISLSMNFMKGIKSWNPKKSNHRDQVINLVSTLMRTIINKGEYLVT